MPVVLVKDQPSRA